VSENSDWVTGVLSLAVVISAGMVAGGGGASAMVRREGGRLQRRRTGEAAGDGAQGKEVAEERNVRGKTDGIVLH
jgi:hypothetical protein